MTDTKENIRCAEEKAFRENYRKMPTEAQCESSQNKKYFETYKKIKKEIILSDEERFHFEEIVIGTVKMIKNSYVM